MLIRAWLMAMIASLVLVSPLAATPAISAPATRVLLFTASESDGVAHSVTDDAATLIEMTGRRHGLEIDTTDDAAVFSRRSLDTYDVVVWLNNRGHVLTADQRTAFADWYRDGGGFIGIHAAAYAEPGWGFFDELVGARPVTGERDKPSRRTITVSADHPAAAGMPTEWTDQEEQWYRFDRNPEDNAGTTVLATVPSHHGDGVDPVAWCRNFDGGRTWYLAMGHRVKTYENGDYTKLLRGGISWVSGLEKQPPVQDRDAAVNWPYPVSFVAWVAAIAVGGSLAVRALNRRDAAGRPDSP